MTEVEATPSLNRVCIIGAGAIGGWIASALESVGCDVSLVARGATLAALRENGLVMQRAAPDDPATVLSTHHKVRASDDPAQLGPHDLVVLAVKGPAMASVARAIGPLLGPDTVVLSAMNGLPWWFLQGLKGPLEGRTLQSVDATGEIAAAIPLHHVIGGVVHGSCVQVAPGVIRHNFGRGLIVGEPSGVSTPRVQALFALLQRAGFEASLSSCIQRDMWYKLWGNMTVNPLSAMTGATTNLLLNDELVRNFMSAMMLEARDIGARFGLPITEQPDDRHAVTRKLGAFKSSMLQDVEAGRAIELDGLVTVVRELGGLTGVATPNIDALLGLTRVFARLRGLYP